MRIAFLGLGGVGGYFAAKLARQTSTAPRLRSGQALSLTNSPEIICLARERTAAAIRSNGIKLITPEEEFVAHPDCVATNAREAGRVDFLIVSVKSYDLESSLSQFRGCISSQTIILPLLNGIDAEEKIRLMFPENEVWSGCVYIVSRITAPGVITETGNIHQLHFGVGSNSLQHSENKPADLLRILKSAHDDVFLHDNIREVVWEKFIFISTIASLTSYLDSSIGKILDTKSSFDLLTQLLAEIYSVSRAENIALPENIIDLTIEKMSRLPYETTSSMHSDFQKGNATEHESLTGHVVRLAEKHLISAPAFTMVYANLKTR
jgi:2-dehydropantoate 2-reductase